MQLTVSCGFYWLPDIVTIGLRLPAIVRSAITTITVDEDALPETTVPKHIFPALTTLVIHRDDSSNTHLAGYLQVEDECETLNQIKEGKNDQGLIEKNESLPWSS